MKHTKTFQEILAEVKAREPESRTGQVCQIISLQTTERSGKRKKDKMYQQKHKRNFRDEVALFYAPYFRNRLCLNTFLRVTVPSGNCSSTDTRSVVA